MFLKDQPEENTQHYIELLQAVGSLSKLFSDSNVPYLYYRVAENAFCKAFIADNLSRSDTSADAKKEKIGIGLKTFLGNSSGNSYQKVAEFNKNRHLYQKYEGNNEVELVLAVSKMRNERISSTLGIHDIDKIIYHNVVRKENSFAIHEENMDAVDLRNISDIKKSRNSVYFNDKKNEYRFNLSKSTLLKKFKPSLEMEFEVNTFKDPFEIIESYMGANAKDLVSTRAVYTGTILLPLFSLKSGVKYVPEKSGLNQWNASGRERATREVYIPIPSWIHREFAGFLPNRSEHFNLKLPSGRVLNASVCQSGDKAIMSNPNKDLGEWILGDVLNIEPGKIVTMEKLDEIGIDSVEIRKIDNNNFQMDFKQTGSFDEFEENLSL